MAVEFEAWPKTPRLFRDIIITEKIDGTNAAIIVKPFEATDIGQGLAVNYQDETYTVAAQSRTRLITPCSDNFGFAAWVWENAPALARTLGPGRHFGEWWGSGIQRGYDLPKGVRMFSLFNVNRYAHVMESASPGLPGLVTVPVLYRGPFDQWVIEQTLAELRRYGSRARPGFDRPEGVVVFHSASRQVYKVLLENDALPKSLIPNA